MKTKNDGWTLFLKLCQHAQSKKQLDEVLQAFLTMEEREQIATRAQLVKKLLSGKQTQREIASDLKISIAKITRGSHVVKQLDPQLRKFLEGELDVHSS